MEKYISQCISSIINQTLFDWELILVNDGSTDKSLDICNSFAEKDCRIYVINKDNTGVSDSRNIALEKSKGRFIAFVDADDYLVDNTVLEKIVRVATENNLDIIRGEYKAVDEFGNFLFTRILSKSVLEYSNKVISSSSFLINVLNRDFFLCLCLFRRDIIVEIKFEIGRVYLEDMRLLVLLLTNKKLRCMYLPDFVFYSYRKSPQSVSSKIDCRKIKDSFSMSSLFNVLSLTSECLELKRYFQNFSMFLYLRSIEMLAYGGYYSNRYKYINEFSVNKTRSEICKNISINQGIGHFFMFHVPSIVCVYLFRFRHKLSYFKKILFVCR